LYALRGINAEKGTKKKAIIIWLALEAEHYRWLQLAGTPAEAALPKPIIVGKDNLASLRRQRPAAKGTELTQPAAPRAPEGPDAKKQKRAEPDADTLEGGGRAESTSTRRSAATCSSAAVRRRLGLASVASSGTAAGAATARQPSTKRSRAESTGATSRVVRRRLGLDAASVVTTRAGLAAGAPDGEADRTRERRRLRTKTMPPKRPAFGQPASVATVAGDELEALQPFVRGSHLQCPCGWTADPHMSAQKRQTAAHRHWRDCQGTAPPKLSREQLRHISAGMSTFGPGPQRRAASARQRFEQWAKDLSRRSPPAAAAACSPDLGVPFNIDTPSGPKLEYTCVKCGQQRMLANFRRLPCRARCSSASGGFTRDAWIAEAVGSKQAASIREAHKRRDRQWRSTKEGRRTVAGYNRKQHLRRKAEKELATPRAAL
jgi:hypothetical protein